MAFMPLPFPSTRTSFAFEEQAVRLQEDPLRIEQADVLA